MFSQKKLWVSRDRVIRRDLKESNICLSFSAKKPILEKDGIFDLTCDMTFSPFEWQSYKQYLKEGGIPLKRGECKQVRLGDIKYDRIKRLT